MQQLGRRFQKLARKYKKALKFSNYGNRIVVSHLVTPFKFLQELLIVFQFSANSCHSIKKSVTTDADRKLIPDAFFATHPLPRPPHQCKRRGRTPKEHIELNCLGKTLFTFPAVYCRLKVPLTNTNICLMGISLASKKYADCRRFVR